MSYNKFMKFAQFLPILIQSIRSLDEAFRSDKGLPPPTPLPETWEGLVAEFTEQEGSVSDEDGLEEIERSINSLK